MLVINELTSIIRLNNHIQHTIFLPTVNFSINKFELLIIYYYFSSIASFTSISVFRFEPVTIIPLRYTCNRPIFVIQVLIFNLTF